MAKRIKIALLYASAGHGHEKAARAVEERAKAAGHDVSCFDTLTMTPRFFGDNYRLSYLWMISSWPALWGLLYHAADWPWLHFALRPLRRLVNSRMASTLEKWLIEEKPDAVVSTHFLSTEVVGNMKRQGRFSGKNITVITDFMPHYFWLESGVDVYAVAAEATKSELIRRRIDADRIAVTGIPIASQFAYPLDKTVQRGFLHIGADAFVVLLTSGGAGVGTTGELAESLLSLGPQVRLLAVCGTNEKLRAGLVKRAEADSRLKVFGFVNNMDELMAASDLVVGKAGGLTLSESLAMHVPMAILKPVPGQEARNAQAASQAGAAFLVKDTADLTRLVKDLLTDRSRLETAKLAASRMARPAAAEAILELCVHD